MDRPVGTNQGPRRAALLVLAIAALAGIATSATPPNVQDRAVGEVGIDGGTSQTRELRIHLAPPVGAGPTHGTLDVGLRTAADIGPGYAPAITVTIADPDGTPVASPGSTFNEVALPVETCARGCDLAYQLIFTADPDLGPAASFRYQAIARFTWDDYRGQPGPRGLRVETSGGGDAIPPIGWSLIVGAMLVGLVAGVTIGARLRAAGRLRRLPARVLIGILVVFGAWPLVVYGLYTVMPELDLGVDVGWPYQSTIAIGWFAAALLLVLAIGLTLGLRRLERDDGWSLGLAGVGTAALGGVWLGWTIGSFGVMRPIVMAALVAGLGCLAGVVVGQAWGGGRPGIAGRRLWPSLAIVSQGFIIAGLVYTGLVAYDPTAFETASAVALVPFVAALVVAAGTWRWFHGSRWLMLLANLILLATGLLGAFLVSGFGGLQGLYDSGTVPFGAFVLMEVAATFVGFVAATRRFGGRPAAPTETAPDLPLDVRDAAGLPTA